MKKLTILFLCVLLASGGAMAQQANSDSRMAWWRDARFGMFIHWGVYAQLAGSMTGTLSGRRRSGS
ncbi:alpha-L-fucosidase [Puia sp. P3]|uniref:alpha-L-fucosidase n=1 Tax=Puia sp. P3 TaxID=3423952 RepID=UPI003D6784D4